MTGLAVLCSTTMRRFQQMLRDDSGATAIEYAMIACGVGTAVAATIFSLGSSLRSNFYEKIAGMFN